MLGRAGYVGRVGVVSQRGASGPFDITASAGYGFYTSGSRANVGSGVVSSLTVLGGRPALVTAGSPTVSGGVLTFDGTDDTAQSAAISTQSATLSMTSAVELPAASGSGANGGFTCTGIAKLPNGGWVLGNDGRTLEGDGSNSLTSSLVFLSSDFTTKTNEILMSTLGIAATNKSLQGVVYVPASNQIAFVLTTGSGGGGAGRVHLLNATTFAYVGEWSPGGSPFGDITDLNGIGYDPDTDCFILLSVNSGSVPWRGRTSGTLIKTIAVTGALSNDQVFYSNARHTLFYTTGASGTTGRLIERGASARVQNVITDFTLTGADAIEGCYIDGNTLYIVNDAGYHAGGATIKKNRVLIYDISSLNPTPVWPIGSNVQLFGILRVPASAAATARIIMGIGASVNNQTGGVSMSLPAGTTTQLRALQNSFNVTWNTPDLTSKHMAFIHIDLAADTAELWVDGVSLGSLDFTAATTDWVDPSPPYLASDQGVSRFFPGEITCMGATVGRLQDRQKVEGFMAWDTSNTALLPNDHPYKNVAP